MNNYIHKFEALSSFNVNELLKEYGMTISDLDNIINKIGKYSVGHDLYLDISRSKKVNYRDLRKWKLDNYLSRYEELKPTISKIEYIEDLLVGISDLECRVDISADPKNPYKGHLSIEFAAWPNKAIKKINDITSELLHISNHLETKFLDFTTNSDVVCIISLEYSVVNI